MSSSSAQIKSDARTILRLGWPLIANNLANAGMTFADTVMAGQLGARELAGLAVGVSYYNLCFFFGVGVLMALSPSVAHAFGANDDAGVARYFRQSWWIVLGLSVCMIAAMWQSELVFAAFEIDADVLPIAVAYAETLSFGLPAFFGFFALRFTIEGLGITRPTMYVSFLGLAINVLGNWLLIYGHWGMPKLGVIGCAVATVASEWITLFAMIAYAARNPALRAYAFFQHFELPNIDVLRQLLRIGVPIAFSLLSEGGLFVVAALLLGSMGATTTSAHQIALNYASLMFMIPLALHSATTIHVGHALGRHDRAAARIAGWTGIALCGIIMSISAILLVLLNTRIASMYTNDGAVRDLAATLLLMAAIFQVSDGLQVGAGGALRGFKDTTVPMAITLFAYWLVGFPVAYILGVRQAMGPVYVWLGLILGLSVAALLLNLRYRIVANRAAMVTSVG